ANAAFILGVVEIERLEAIEHRTDDLARGRGDAAMHDGDLVLQRRLLGELGIELHVRLRVVVDELELPPQKSAGCIGLLDCKRQRVHHRLAIDVEPAREVVDAGHADRVFREGRSRKSAGCNGSGGTSQELPAMHAHCATLSVLPRRRQTRYFFKIDAPTVYFGSTMLPSRM